MTEPLPPAADDDPSRIIRQLSEQGFDAAQVQGVVQGMRALGFRIEPVPPPAARAVPFVRWEGRALGKVPERLRPPLERDLERVFDGPDVRQVTVEDCFTGYHGNPEQKLILGVELTTTVETRTHIVKLGAREQVRPDWEGWERCVGARYVGSRLFVKPDYRDLPAWIGADGNAAAHSRGAAVYPNAYQLFGLDQTTQQPKSLDDVTRWAVLDDKPDPESIERVISQIYGDLHRWFYCAARDDRARAVEFYERRLARARERWSCRGGADPQWQDERKQRMELRRDAVWLFCGLDRPDAEGPPVYLDPYDFVEWALEQHQVPDTLVGRSHGDLHGLNVLVGVHRGEAEFPVVFDYGEMGPDNVLAWDFVKLEFELKTRIIPRLYEDPAARTSLLARRGTKPPKETQGGASASEPVRCAAERAWRLAFVFEFETLLMEATARIDDHASAMSRRPPGPLPLFADNSKIDRALRVLLRIRQEAALWLGYEHPGRHDRWPDEYCFAAAVYGLSTAKWPNYDPKQTECALVAAGVACARLRLARQALLRGPAAAAAGSGRAPSYRVPLHQAHTLWTAGYMAEALQVIQAAQSQFEESVPLAVEHALLLAEVGRLHDAEGRIEPLRTLAGVFGDFEMLSRLGRIFKNYADKTWTADVVPFVNSAPWQYYRRAFTLYDEAFRLSGEYFPGVNAATLAVLLGGEWTNRGRAIAARVCEICQTNDPPADIEQRYWLFASEGEANLVLGTPDSSRRAAGFYRSALELVDPESQINWAQSSWNQLCRLWEALGSSVLEPVLAVFDDYPKVRQRLNRGPLRNCGRG